MRTQRIGTGIVIGLCLATALTACGDDDNNTFGGPNVPPPSQGVTPGDVLAVTSSGRLVTLNRAAPALTTAIAITGLASGETILGIDTRPGGTTPGQIYLLGSSGRLYTVDPTSGAATLKSTLTADTTVAGNTFTALSGTEYGVDFNPVVDRLRIVSDTGQNLRVNVDTGAVIADGNLNTATVARMGVTDAAYTNDYATTCRTTLFYIDTTTDKLLTTTDPNNGVLTEVGPLGVDASAVGGFEIATDASGNNTALAVFTVNSTPTLYQINLQTGAATTNGAVTSLNGGEVIRGITTNPPASGPPNAFGQVAGLTESGKLISFTTTAPQKLCTTATVTGAQASETILGIDTRPANGKIYALGSTGRIYTLDPATAALTMISQLAADPADTVDPFTALSGTEFGVDFNPVPDRLRVVSDTGQNLRINVDTGLVTTDTPLNPAGPVAVAAAYTNSFAGAGTTTLYDIDAAGDQLVIQGQPSGSPNNGDLQPVGPLGVGDIQSIAGFDISGTNNAAVAAFNIAGATLSELHNINLLTGASKKVNNIGGGERVRGLTLTANPVATVYGTTADNKLVSFKLATPATFDSSTAISGLQGGDTVIGADFRPANGKLYAVTNSGRLYTVNPMTATATMVATLTADAADMSAPFTSLMGSNFGVDFNPLADRLRVVSDIGQNLRINVDTGAVTTDTNIVPATGAAMIVASAYTNNFPAPPATQLLDIDVVTSSLQLQDPPNNGTLAPIGVLDPVNATMFTGTGGFDIVGGDNGLSLAALQPAGAAQQSLYRVNIKTGATTSLGLLGAAGGAPLNGLAIQLK